MPRATKEPAEKFGIALVAWVVGCAALAYEAKSFRSVVATRALALALAVLGTAALFLSKALREVRAEAQAASARRNEIALELMATRNRFMHTAESVRVGRAIKVRKSDVFVVTYPKCGTTWMTQICQMLRSRGSMDFGEITEVCPWDILAHDCGQNLDDDQLASPRVFKSHESHADIAKGGKYIYVARDPLDAFFSFYKFLPAYTGLQPNDIDERAFSDAIFAGASHSGQIWNHLLGWWDHRHDPNVLFIFFEDLAENLREQVVRVATFMGLDPNDEPLIKLVLERASFDFMSSEQQAHHFDDHFVRSKILPKMGLAPNTPLLVSKVRRDGGTVGSRRKLPEDVALKLKAKWATIVQPRTGCADYAALRESLRLGQ
ncbi:hypothetical protein Ctob_008452 [Chrysochromulina tobinii]|uniref:Sulfotransferase domain-containing protein n=1 Tax=Chrysochromulina tobinii TaxID=1460289 RepID=A0A0M0JNG6_9EUKA|nr:hypothetical protein Ctob_008452 [Chrysochromulina tobinii]|eukprot:KOO27862.1 hypothetical protein Ctob_008452 [Chrysochromulina sp. CCMP291]